MYRDDHYFILADLQSYIDTQQQAAALYSRQELWPEKSILNIARTGRFPSDRTIRKHAQTIWHLQPVK